MDKQAPTMLLRPCLGQLHTWKIINPQGDSVMAVVRMRFHADGRAHVEQLPQGDEWVHIAQHDLERVASSRGKDGDGARSLRRATP